MRSQPFSLVLCLSITLLFFCSTTSMASNHGHGHSHEGVVKETMNAGGYTYMLLDDQGNEYWVAIPITEVQVGEEVHFIHGMELQNFTSKSLNRTFESITFSEGLDTNAQQKSAHSELFASAVEQENSLASGHLDDSVGSSGAVAPFIDAPVEKAAGDNAYTVAELFEKRTELTGQKIVIQGKVIKVTQNIMGKNWVHLQDGSGNPIHNTHDLVVTTSEVPTAGDIITMEGVVTVDRDFGYSYKYELLVEEGKIVSAN